MAELKDIRCDICNKRQPSRKDVNHDISVRNEDNGSAYSEVCAKCYEAVVETINKLKGQ